MFQEKEPPKQGSWSEVFLIIRIVFEVLLPPLAGIFGSLILVATFFVLLLNGSIYCLVPIGLFGLGIWYLIRKTSTEYPEQDKELESFYKKF